MLNQAIAMVVQKTGISNDQATTAVHTVISFLKEKLPAPLASQLDSLVAGGAAASMLGGLAGGAGSMLGGLGGQAAAAGGEATSGIAGQAADAAKKLGGLF